MPQPGLVESRLQFQRRQQPQFGAEVEAATGPHFALPHTGHQRAGRCVGQAPQVHRRFHQRNPRGRRHHQAAADITFSQQGRGCRRAKLGMGKQVQPPFQAARSVAVQPRADHLLHHRTTGAVAHLVGIDVEKELVERPQAAPTHAVESLQAADAGLVDEAAVVAKAGADVVDAEGRLACAGLAHGAQAQAVAIDGRATNQLSAATVQVRQRRAARVQPVPAHAPLIADLPRHIRPQHGVVATALFIAACRDDATIGQGPGVAAGVQGDAVGRRLLGHAGAKGAGQQDEALAAVADGERRAGPFRPAPRRAQAAAWLREAAGVERVGGCAQEVGGLEEKGSLLGQAECKARVARQLRHVKRDLRKVGVQRRVHHQFSARAPLDVQAGIRVVLAALAHAGIARAAQRDAGAQR